MSFIFDIFKRLFQKMISFLSFGTSELSNKLSVYIKTNTGDTVAVDLDPKWDIKNVKEHVAPRIGLQPEEVKIIFAGKELSNSTVVEDCDLGEKSILHVVRVLGRKKRTPVELSTTEEVEEGSKPLSETLLDLQLTSKERADVLDSDKPKVKAHFYVWCGACKKLCEGKLRVRCATCGSGAFTVHADPQAWPDVLLPNALTGECLNQPSCSTVYHDRGPSFAEFYFRCANHTSQGEKDQAVPLDLIKPNLKDIPCLACTDHSETVLVFPCNAGHVTCLDCFRLYCSSRLSERQFLCHPVHGYTLPCPAGCEDSFIEEIHHFKLLTEAQYNQYQLFATEEFVLQAGGVLCPQPGCGMGILVDPECTKVTCQNGCGYVFCMKCLQGYHIGDCDASRDEATSEGDCNYSVDPVKADEARWDAASKVTIRVISKPCPSCRTPTERDGGCMHIVCTRAGCGYEWCWVCQTAWTRDCMGAHWFG